MHVSLPARPERRARRREPPLRARRGMVPLEVEASIDSELARLRLSVSETARSVTSSPVGRRDALSRLRRELLSHLSAEERIFLPSDPAPATLLALRASLLERVARLDDASCADPSWSIELRELVERADRYIEEVESGQLPRLRDELGMSKAAQLVGRFLIEKAEARRAYEPLSI